METPSRPIRSGSHRFQIVQNTARCCFQHQCFPWPEEKRGGGGKLLPSLIGSQSSQYIKYCLTTNKVDESQFNRDGYSFTFSTFLLPWHQISQILSSSFKYYYSSFRLGFKWITLWGPRRADSQHSFKKTHTKNAKRMQVYPGRRRTEDC